MKKALDKQDVGVIHIECGYVNTSNSTQDYFNLLFDALGLDSEDYNTNVNNFDFLLHYYSLQNRRLVLILDSFQNVYNEQYDQQYLKDFLLMLQEKSEQYNIRLMYCLDNIILSEKLYEWHEGLVIQQNNLCNKQQNKGKHGWKVHLKAAPGR